MGNNIPTTDEGFKLHVISSLATLTEGQQNMSTRLFGGEGQTGVIQEITKYIAKMEAESKERDDKLGEVGENLAKNLMSIGNRVWWFSGVAAAAGAFLALALRLLGLK